MTGERTAHTGPSTGRRVRTIAGWVIAAACLAWLFHDVHLGRMAGDVARIQWRWVAAAVVLDIVSYCIQGLRWALLLKPVGRVSPASAIGAIYVGLFTNEIIPLRVGEVVRTYLMSRRLAAPFTAVLPSLVIERFFDGVWLAAGIGLTALFVPLPRSVADAGDLLGIVVLIAMVALAAIVITHASRISRAPATAPVDGNPMMRFTGRFAAGIAAIGLTPAFWSSFALSSLLLISQIFSFWFVMISYGIRIPLLAGAAVLIIEHLGTTVPNAPSNLGTYQFFTVLGLSLFGIDKTTATGFSMVVFIALTLPLWIIGLAALARSGLTLRAIRNEIALLGRRHAPEKG
jgi:hypothetical protein